MREERTFIDFGFAVDFHSANVEGQKGVFGREGKRKSFSNWKDKLFQSKEMPNDSFFNRFLLGNTKLGDSHLN
jgi:hypothetical protein